MKTALKIFGICAGLFIAFVIWRFTSVFRGARQRDEKLIAAIEPIGKRLEAGEPVSPNEIADLAARPELRFMLFAALREWKRPDLLPTNYSSTISQGESALVYWMMHPNELQAAPEKIELLETMKRPADGQEMEFRVYRYRMPTGHWAAKDGWLLGVVGPMKVTTEPYTDRPAAFSRVSDVEGKIKPAELVDWYVDTIRARGMIK